MGKPDKAGEENGTIEAIRSLVEENELALQSLEDEVLTLDDIVWRSPARQIVDTTDIIQRLAEEADKVANGQAAEPPRAAQSGRSPALPSSPRRAQHRLPVEWQLWAHYCHQLHAGAAAWYVPPLQHSGHLFRRC